MIIFSHLDIFPLNLNYASIEERWKQIIKQEKALCQFILKKSISLFNGFIFHDLPTPGVEPMSPAWAVGSFTAEQPGKPVLMFVHIQSSNVMLMFFWRGSKQANVHQCSEVTGGLLPPPPLSGWWVFSLMGISSPRHYPFISNWSLHWPFPLFQLPFPHPYNFTELN